MKRKRVIVAGSRTFIDRYVLEDALDGLYANKHIRVVCGEAKGADRMGKRWAKSRGIPVKSFPADWDNRGKSAGPKRNSGMAEYAHALVAFWDGRSRGTADMINKALDRKLEIHICLLGLDIWTRRARLRYAENQAGQLNASVVARLPEAARQEVQDPQSLHRRLIGRSCAHQPRHLHEKRDSRRRRGRKGHSLDVLCRVLRPNTRNT